VSVEPETLYGKWMTVGGTQMPPRVSTGDRDAVLRQFSRCAVDEPSVIVATCVTMPVHTLHRRHYQTSPTD